MKNTINKIITVQQALVAKFLKANQDLNSIAMSESELSGITITLNNILAKFESTGESPGDNGSQPSEPSDTPTTSILDEIPGANPNQKALQVSGIQNSALLFESILNGLYIPIFEDGTETSNKKYVNAIKVNNEIIGYSMLYIANVGNANCWKFDFAQYIDGQYKARDVFEIWASENRQAQYSGQPSGITQVFDGFITGPYGAQNITVQEIDWSTLDMLPNITDTSMMLFKVESCTNDATDLNGYYFECGSNFVNNYYSSISEKMSYSYYCNVNLSLIACVMDFDHELEKEMVRAYFISKSSGTCFIGDTQDNGDSDTSENYKSITNITAEKDNVGTPTITILQ